MDAPRNLKQLGKVIVDKNIGLIWQWPGSRPMRIDNFLAFHGQNKWGFKMGNRQFYWHTLNYDRGEWALAEKKISGYENRSCYVNGVYSLDHLPIFRYEITVTLNPHIRLTEDEENYVLAVLGCCFACVKKGPPYGDLGLKVKEKKRQKLLNYLYW
ncbi:hypothetical protein SCHPADRAFT_894310 [Schizopora paradoxa]|uniref:Uncharacterized protein n=1 Tax=Schizopora paradoxa TaxID=27342 RepID=A0A0H2RSP4_9AGAM|nr:hypothetical protein SCHPADRAFT_894310 [Schizopora paradoxa]